MPQKFTASTLHRPLSRLDSKILAPTVPYVYEDMRGNLWNVIRTEDGWRAGPQKNIYGLTAGTFAIDSFGTSGTATAAASMVKGIEEHAEEWRVSQKHKATESGGGLLLVLVALFVLTHKGR